MKKAIYALSADPITLGHLNIIQRALYVFDHVTIGIGVNPDKKYTFTLEERENLARAAIGKMNKNVSVRSFPGLLSDFAYENGIHTIIRGARNSSDFDFERLLADINQSFRQGLDTLIYVAENGLSHISSSAAKELVKNQAKNLLEYVPIVVKRALERKIKKQYLIGITGEIACGKTHVAEALCKVHVQRPMNLEVSKMKMTNVDLDSLGREILESAQGAIYTDTRTQLIDHFGDEITGVDRDTIITSRLSDIIFKDAGKLSLFNDIMREPMLLLLRRKLMGLEGIILINSALIAEADISTLVNNEVVLVRATRETQVERMIGRGYPEDKIGHRLQAQMTSDKKEEYIQHKIKESGFGKIISFDNSKENSVNAIDDLYEEIVGSMVLN